MTCTVHDLRDYLDWQCQIGHGQHTPVLCPRGLDAFRPGDKPPLAIPEDGHTSDDANRLVFIRAIFKE